jgi:HEAT repeat protein
MTGLLKGLGKWFVLLLRAPNVDRMKRDGDTAGLLEALQYPLFRTVGAATRALGELWSMPDLVDLGHPDGKVRTAAAERLKESRDKRVIAPLIAALRDPYTSYRDTFDRATYPVRMNAIEALAEMGDPVAIEPILDAIRRQTVSSGFMESCDRLDAALVKMGEPMFARLIAALEEDYDDESWSRINSALERFGDARAITPLCKRLARERRLNIRASAFQAIVVIGGEAAVSGLAALLRQEQSPDRQFGIFTVMNEIKDKSVIPALVKALQEADPAWRHKAVEYLAKFGTPISRVALEEYQRQSAAPS